MSELRCHYCGAECRVDGEADIYVHCPECGADGPICGSREAAVAAHATVAPAPRWTTGFAPGEGVSLCQDESGAVGFAGEYEGRIVTSPHLGRVVRYARFPSPADAVEGGGE